MKKIFVCEPYLQDEEIINVNIALREKAISGLFGEYLTRFEENFADYCGCTYGIVTNSGTSALHLAVAVLSIGNGDEVLVSTLTNMATFFSVLYQGATPIPVDIEPDTLNMNPSLLESKITPRTKAIIVVHLFGHPANMDPIIEIANKYNLFVIEDCAQAHGATYNGKRVGGIGTIGCFSFYANKIITTGEGGMLTTNDKTIAKKTQSLKSLAFGTKNKFMHDHIGYNYRMTNIQAAIGCAQLGKISKIIENKRRIAGFYHNALKIIPLLQLPVEKEYALNVYWMYHIVLKTTDITIRNRIMSKLLENGIETREGFIPYNMQKIFIDKGLVNINDCPVANEVAETSFYLPSGVTISNDDLEYVSATLKDILRSI